MERAGRLIRKLKFSPEMADPEVRARAAWRLAAGKKVAEHTRASAFVRGKLIVEVGDHVWQQQLTPLRKFLLDNLEEALGERLVTDLDFRPMPRRIAPQMAETAHPLEGIEDPVLEMLYKQAKKRSSA